MEENIPKGKGDQKIDPNAPKGVFKKWNWWQRFSDWLHNVEKDSRTVASTTVSTEQPKVKLPGSSQG